jgi:hypothetical protein
MVSWSLLTVHRIHAISLQFMQGFYDGQQRPLTSNTTQKMQLVKFRILESEKILTILFGLYNLNQWYF